MAYATIDDGTVVQVDDQDIALLERYTWRRDKNGYAQRRTSLNGKEGYNMFLHREIMGAVKGQVVDHISGDIDDNRRENLRICTNNQNIKNQKKQRVKTSSIYKGVSLVKGRWQAQIGHEKQHYYLGMFDDEMLAAHAYNKAAVALHGEYACINPIGFDKMTHQPNEQEQR
jgi:hypothetical protein